MKGASSFLMQSVKAFECFWFAQVIILSWLAAFSDAALACCKYTAANIPMTDATTMVVSNIINIIGIIRIAVLLVLL
jgi:hypothetical protein